MQINRRTFLKFSVIAGGGLTLAFSLAEQAEAAAAAFQPNAFLKIAADGSVVVVVGKSEMGQGILTALAMLVAEELEADWSRVRIEQAPADPAYAGPGGQQFTGGSTSVRTSWMTLRQAGATAREMLIEAARREWNVRPGECIARQGAVLHAASGRRADFGRLAERAAQLPVLGDVRLKEPAEFRLIGQAVPRQDIPAKVDGSAVFGLDIYRPGMLTAVVARCPVFGGKARTINSKAAEQIPGVVAVIPLDSGIAVVAEHFWAAQRGRTALQIEWDLGAAAKLDSTAIRGQLKTLTDKPGKVVKEVGRSAQAEKKSGTVLQAIYEVPYQAHACMEPMNGVADVTAAGCELWLPTQGQSGAQTAAMKLTGLPREKVHVHTTLLGGGFGRRFEQDFVQEAVALSMATKKPVKVVWTRDDDLTHDFYRPASCHRLYGVLDGKGVASWRHHIAVQSILSRVFPGAVKDGVDFTSIEGVANLPYTIPNLRVELQTAVLPVPVGFWRSVGSSQNAFVVECFLDELAHAGKHDPLALRLKLLTEHPRHREVLQQAAQRAGWGKPRPGRALGLAVHECFGSIVAEVAEVSVAKGKITVHRVVCAIDCGMVVNPDTVRAQVESSIVFGLTAALKGAITLKDGRVEQTNFHNYPLLSIDETPEIETIIITSAEPPGGVGEPATPPIAPAVANAVFAATGKRLRSLPLQL